VLLRISSAGGRVALHAREALDRIDAWILERPGRAPALLTVLVLGYCSLWCGVSFLRHYYFHSSYDLAIMNQVVWNSSQGRLLDRTIEVTSDLGDHVRPYLAVLSLAYLFVASPYVLLAFQSVVLSLSAVPLYRLARRQLASPAVALCVAFCSLAYPPLGFVNRYDFHVEVLCIPLLIWIYERIDAGDLRSASVLMFLTLFCKENLGLTVAAMGVMAALFYGYRRFGVSWAVAGAAYSAIALLVVIPAFRGGPSDTLARYHWLDSSPSGMVWALLSQPLAVLERLFAPERLTTLMHLLAPFAFLPLAGWAALLPAAPTLAYNFLADWSSQGTIYAHYMAPVLPFMSIATVVGLRRLGSRAMFDGRNDPSDGLPRLNHSLILGACVLMVVAVSASWVYENPVMGNGPVAVFKAAPQTQASTARPQSLVWSNDRAIRDGLESVPPAAGVLTTAHYAAHLSQRTWIEMIPKAPVANLHREATVIFLNLRDLRSWSCEDYFATLAAASRQQFGVVYYREGIVLIERGAGDRARLQGLVRSWRGCD
jgi:uncharacterized membrane protein